MKLFTVISINRATGEEHPPRYDLAPMNHAAACNFMEACRNESTDYKLADWPAEVMPTKAPCFAMGYRRDKSVIPFTEAVECKDTLESLHRAACDRLRTVSGDEKGPMGLTPDHIKATDEWKAARRDMERAQRNVADFNQQFLKAYGKEWKAEVMRRRSVPATS